MKGRLYHAALASPMISAGGQQTLAQDGLQHLVIVILFAVVLEVFSEDVLDVVRMIDQVASVRADAVVNQVAWNGSHLQHETKGIAARFQQVTYQRQAIQAGRPSGHGQTSIFNHPKRLAGRRDIGLHFIIGDVHLQYIPSDYENDPFADIGHPVRQALQIVRHPKQIIASIDGGCVRDHVG